MSHRRSYRIGYLPILTKHARRPNERWRSQAYVYPWPVDEADASRASRVAVEPFSFPETRDVHGNK
jgi:hypothetical protein